MRTVMAALLCFFLVCCTPSGRIAPISDSPNGPSDLEVSNALDQRFARNSENPYYGICGGKLEKNILNREVRGKEAQARIEGTWKSKMYNCDQHREVFTVELVNRNGKWEEAE